MYAYDVDYSFTSKLHANHVVYLNILGGMYKVFLCSYKMYTPKKLYVRPV